MAFSFQCNEADCEEFGTARTIELKMLEAMMAVKGLPFTLAYVDQLRAETIEHLNRASGAQ